ncbi:MAG: acireductone synthase [Candidatus Eremiobacteraeota bacterium]|nr:acireductone synthase [Candidatus Eremiobacteraeota bacterium]
MAGSRSSPARRLPRSFRRSSPNGVALRAAVALLDIEGTIGSIAFVKDVLFPYARQRMASFVEAHKEEDAMRALLDATARESGVDAHDLNAILRVLFEWSDADYKIQPLKELQGMIWKDGFESGTLKAELYDDAVEAFRRFRLEGVHLYIYSSGSVQAQKLLFGHSVHGDLRPLFEGYFDTGTGAKRDPSSYRRIAEAIGVPARDVVFFSDHVAELDAARIAGMQTVQLARPQDGVRAAGTHPSTDTFDTIDIAR